MTRPLDGERLIEGIKGIYAELAKTNSQAARAMSEEDRAEIRAETTGANTMLHAVVRWIRQEMTQ